MNASSISPPPTLVEENNIDSDTNSDDPPEYYQPISAAGDDDGDCSEDSNNSNSDEEHQAYDPHTLDNGHCALEAANGISSVQLNDEADQKSSDEEEEEEEAEEEERMREASDAAMRRALRDDETRRNEPLTSENATRIMEAMRGVSFRGLAPDWTDRIPEDQWIDRLRRLRQSPSVHY